MDGGAWWATAQGVQRVEHDQAAKLVGGGGGRKRWLDGRLPVLPCSVSEYQPFSQK